MIKIQQTIKINNYKKVNLEIFPNNKLQSQNFQVLSLQLFIRGKIIRNNKIIKFKLINSMTLFKINLI